MERMIFDKSYNPLKKEENPDQTGTQENEENDEEEAKRKAELRARFAAA